MLALKYLNSVINDDLFFDVIALKVVQKKIRQYGNVHINFKQVLSSISDRLDGLKYVGLTREHVEVQLLENLTSLISKYLEDMKVA